MIRYKLIEEERTQDAPFIGALVCAPSCNNSKCKGCFNQHLKKLDNKEEDGVDLLDRIFSNPLNEGIILSGLEWSDNPYNMVDIIVDFYFAYSNKKCILYTRKSYEEIKEIILKVFLIYGHDPKESLLKMNLIFETLYVKTGEYRADLPSKVVQGVTLASNNQNIWLNGKCLPTDVTKS